MTTLCAPTPAILCFGCCPPIRPPHYDPLDFVTSLRREYADNRARFRQHGPDQPPIVGFSCWALGYLDARGGRIGCLLHPEQNQGRDLRAATGYGDKCRRERCLAARAFAALSAEAQAYWLEIADGLGPFFYSSARANPLFHVLPWGADILDPMVREAVKLGWTTTELLWRIPLLTASHWSPRGHRYLLRLIWSRDSELLNTGGRYLEAACRALWDRARALPAAQASPFPHPDASHSYYLHQLPLEEDFLDFLRIALGWHRSTWNRAVALKEQIEALL